MEQTLIFPDLSCDACKAAIVKEYQIIKPYLQLIKRGTFLDYYFYICKFCYEEKQRLYRLQSGYTIYKEYSFNE
jgi:hypothetical protein